MTRPRRNFPDSVKREAFERCKDSAGIPRCEDCTAQLSDANIHYSERTDGEFDHDHPDALLGEPTLDNCKVRCRNCHKRKTRRDRKTIAKSNRVADLARGIKTRSRTPLPCGRFDRLKKKLNGTVVERA